MEFAPAVLRCHPGDCGQVTRVTFSDQLFNADGANELNRLPRKRTSQDIVGGIGGEVQTKMEMSLIKLGLVKDVKKTAFSKFFDITM